MSLSVKEILSLGERQLKESGVENADIDSKLLYCHLTNITRTELILEYQNILQDLLCDEYFKLIDRRSTGEPLQYITGTQNFMGYDFEVDENVLIPRSDTENLVQAAADIVDGKDPFGEKLEKRFRRRKWDVLDLCTGSGAIGISLAKMKENTNLTCTDLSREALAVAKKNAASNGVSKRIEFREGNLFEPFRGAFKKKKFDMIVSNPPYIRSDVIPGLQREVKDHEPLTALDGGEDGLDFYRRIIKEAPNFLKKNGILLMEIGHDQKLDIEAMLNEEDSYGKIETLKDLAGLDRVVFATVNDKEKKK